MIPTKQMGRLEVKNSRVLSILADDRRAKKAAELEAWRAANCDRISWDLFYLLEGPEMWHPDDLVVHEDDDGFTVCLLAYHEGIARIRKAGLDGEGNINFSNVPKGDRALSYCFQELFNELKWCDLLNRGIFKQCVNLGLGGMWYEGDTPISEVVERIDEHRGGPEWRQISATNEGQEELDAQFELESITEIPPKSKPWTESAFQKKRRVEYEQEEAGA
ncbi:MAG: hypothetical protein M0Q43_00580 [Methanothrix sp.]|uniref:hypothetical protein n=1 Tax=Methanothrix sp. TaxID=90426 RepID=UPI0025D146EB|nr:hypothetical protein [Methanothrix sp.]MCK9404981.1 hypothetical protein [Methanothrix sp.]MCK9564525.1 hypothetical protein [Methanothrix sp.]